MKYPCSNQTPICAARLAVALFAGAAVFIGVIGASPSPASSQGRPSMRRPQVTPGTVVLHERDREALQEKLRRAVFRAEAEQMPPEPYRQVPLTYDGAVVAIEHGGLGFLTTAAWLTGASRIDLLVAEQKVPLSVERVDARFDLALLRPVRRLDVEVEAVSLAKMTPMLAYALIAPQTKYEQLTQVSVVEGNPNGEHTYWSTTLPATNGYPMLTAEGQLIGVHARRSPDAPGEVGLAVGWPVIAEFLEPSGERAPARAPDRVLEQTWQQGTVSSAPQLPLPAGLR